MDEISLKEIIKLLKDEDKSITCWIANFDAFDCIPPFYLECANDTLLRARKANKKSSPNWQSKVISAWNFARQALECRCDELLGSFGLLAHKETLRADLGTKLALLRDCGVTAPKGLQPLVQKRNDLYHRYIKPHGEQKDEDELENVLSIIDLFIEHTESYLHTIGQLCGAIVLICISKYEPLPPLEPLPALLAETEEIEEAEEPEEYYVAVDLVDLDKLKRDGLMDFTGSKLRIIRTKPPGGHTVSICLATEKREEVAEFMKLARKRGLGGDYIQGDLVEVYREIEDMVIRAIGK